jgi:hypothetical protein
LIVSINLIIYVHSGMEQMKIKFLYRLAQLGNRPAGRLLCTPLGLRQGQQSGSCKHDNELSSSVKHGHVLTTWATIFVRRRTLLCGISEVTCGVRNCKFEAKVTFNERKGNAPQQGYVPQWGYLLRWKL